jgi:bifunctional DNase/RNase
MLHRAHIAGIKMDPVANNTIVMLKIADCEQVIPIWIGLLDATAIASALQNISFERPMTHDLFKNFLGRLDITLSKVEICDLRDNTFFARIYFTSEEQMFDMDARPSDALAIALRFKAPIFVDDKVIEKSNAEFEASAEVADESQEGKKWAEYLESLSPEDFGKYKV